MINEVYLGIGGNIGDTLSILRSALRCIETLGITEFKVSQFYNTQPVSDIPQAMYINAACKFKTTMNPEELIVQLQKIELDHGKTVKPKNAPRAIDIDLLTFGEKHYQINDYEIPHPRWRERLFVLKPLLDLTETIVVPSSNKNNVENVDLIKLVKTFPDYEEMKPMYEEYYETRSC